MSVCPQTPELTQPTGATDKAVSELCLPERQPQVKTGWEEMGMEIKNYQPVHLSGTHRLCHLLTSM